MRCAIEVESLNISSAELHAEARKVRALFTHGNHPNAEESLVIVHTLMNMNRSINIILPVLEKEAKHRTPKRRSNG